MHTNTESAALRLGALRELIARIQRAQTAYQASGTFDPEGDAYYEGYQDALRLVSSQLDCALAAVGELSPEDAELLARWEGRQDA